jgi:hypothetical protein
VAHEMKKAKIKCEFMDGFSLSPDASAEKALRTIWNAVKKDETTEIKIAVEYMDGTEADFEFIDEEDDDED